MTDERFDEHGPEPDFDDPSHTGIRDLLAAARLEAPIPAEVAARLDASLADLAGKAPDEHRDDAVVVPLTRRLAPRLLAAAAVVVIGGAGAVGLNQIAQHHGGSNDVAGSAAPADAAGRTGSAPEAPGATLANPLKGLLGDNLQLAAGTVPVLTTSGFADQVAALNLKHFSTLRAGTLDTRGNQDYSTRRSPAPMPEKSSAGPGTVDSVPTTTGTPSVDEKAAIRQLAKTAAIKALRCTGPGIAGTTSYPILIDGRPAVLVVHPAEDGNKLVQGWSCDGTQVLAYTFVPG